MFAGTRVGLPRGWYAAVPFTIWAAQTVSAPYACAWDTG